MTSVRLQSSPQRPSSTEPREHSPRPAEFEVDLIRARTREGVAIAKAVGKLRGGKPKLNKAQEKHLVELHRASTHTTSDLAELFGVARATVYRAVHRADPK